jgi:uncharacterized protein (DUF1778 family)
MINFFICTDIIRTFNLEFMNLVIMSQNARFDARLSLTQKELLEKAASLGGYRSLSDFVIKVAEDKANEIIEHHELLKLSVADAEVFYTALIEDQQPNAYLQKAAEESAQYFQWKRK